MVRFEDLALAGYFKRVHSCLLQILHENCVSKIINKRQCGHRNVHQIQFLGDKLEIRGLIFKGIMPLQLLLHVD